MPIDSCFRNDFADVLVLQGAERFRAHLARFAFARAS